MEIRGLTHFRDILNILWTFRNLCKQQPHVACMSWQFIIIESKFRQSRHVSFCIKLIQILTSAKHLEKKLLKSCRCISIIFLVQVSITH